jgi:prepilin-type N-terminal cleavage/methylation domain-containing protein
MSLRPFRNHRGFTLPELLVACAMVGVVMAGLFSILRSGQQSYLTGTNQVEAQQALRLTMLRLTNDIREAGYCPSCGTGAAPFSAMIGPTAGTAPSASGFTLQSDWNGNGAISTGLVTQTVMDTTGTTSNVFNVNRGEQIIYSFSAGTLTRREMGVDGTAVTVISNLASLTFTYLDADGVAFVPTLATQANIRTVVVNAVGQPLVQPTAASAGRVQVAMTDSVRLRNRAQ